MTTTKKHPFDLSEEDIKRIVTQMIELEELKTREIIKFYNERFSAVAKLALETAQKHGSYDSEDLSYNQVLEISSEDFSLFRDCIEAYAFEYNLVSEMCEKENPFGHFHIYLTYKNEQYVLRMITGQGTIYGLYQLNTPWEEWDNTKVIVLEDLI